MERQVKDLNILNKFVVDFCELLEKHTNYIVVSGFVAISSGRTRGTEDVDFILKRMEKESFIKLHQDLIENGFECMQSVNPEEIFAYLEASSSVRYIRKDEMLPEAEVKFAKDILDDYQLKTKTKLELTGLDIWFSSINMNVAFKEELLKSDKDMEDAKHLRLIYSGLIDESEIEKIKKMIQELRLK